MLIAKSRWPRLGSSEMPRSEWREEMKPLEEPGGAGPRGRGTRELADLAGPRA